MLVPLALALLSQPEEVSAGDPLPVVSVTAFKDGHALIVREADRMIDGRTLRLDGLPQPLLGTFWPYATEGAVVRSATATRWTEAGERPARSIPELIAANVGRQLTANLTEGEGTRTVSGRILPPPESVSVTLLDDGDGNLLSVPTVSLTSIRIDGEAITTVPTETDRVGLRLHVESGDGEPPGKATVGLMTVEKGIRWIPHYRLTLRDDGTAAYELRATIVNDLIDLNGARVRLVVGVPTFDFAGVADPIQLQANVAQAAGAMIAGGGYGRGDSNRFSNAVQTQIAGDWVREESDEAAAPEVTGSRQAEDLFVFELKNVTLAKGERMSIGVTEGELGYAHRYEVDLPILPPPELNLHYQQAEQYRTVARQLAQPAVRHRLAITNPAPDRTPLTTGPALLFRERDGGRQLLAQTLMTYTPVGGTTLIDLGTAVDVRVELDEEETGRTTNAMQRGGYAYERISLAGRITATSRKAEPITLRVRRYVPGPVGELGAGGTAKILAPFDPELHFGTLGLGGALGLGRTPDLVIAPTWWYAYRPDWYVSLNPTGRAEWTVELPPGKPVELPMAWHYYWR